MMLCHDPSWKFLYKALLELTSDVQVQLLEQATAAKGQVKYNL